MRHKYLLGLVLPTIDPMTDNKPTNIAVRVELADGEGASSDQTVACRLYLHDRRLGCGPPAALCAERTGTIPKGEAFVMISFTPDMNATHSGKKWDEMLGPEMYAALDISNSTVTYDGGPLFGIQPGDADLVLKVKSK
mmetsp:Transcript_572/g.1676  ORF Transcript_572/g.1676 Transcript_572/m.1676 type:complete len:138 (-) Transcript_572:251-664(-)